MRSAAAGFDGFAAAAAFGAVFNFGLAALGFDAPVAFDADLDVAFCAGFAFCVTACFAIGRRAGLAPGFGCELADLAAATSGVARGDPDRLLLLTPGRAVGSFSRTSSDFLRSGLITPQKQFAFAPEAPERELKQIDLRWALARDSKAVRVVDACWHWFGQSSTDLMGLRDNHVTANP